MNKIIIQAIREKQVLQIGYHGYWRIVEPHTYGTNKDGQHILRCYQVGGGSVSGSPVAWKLLFLDEMKSITTTGNCFANPRHGYKYIDPAIPHIFARL